jgi:phytoene desaturase
MKKILVIGSGFGGLATAIRLQALGLDVTILEKNEHIGGHASQLKLKGYTFDMGPSLITAPSIIENVFQAAGRNMSDYLKLIKLDPYYRIYFHDRSWVDYSGNGEEMKVQMASYAPGDAQNYEKFMTRCKMIYDAVITDGLGSEPFMSWKTMLNFMPRALKLNALLPSYQFVSHYFKHPKNRFMYSFHPLFIGANPFRAPSIYLMIPYLEKAGGVWFAQGGMYSLVRAFETVFSELGGTIKTGHEVKEIRIEKGRVKGVVANNTFFPAEAVISNADVAHTYQHLIKSEFRKKWTEKKIEKAGYSMSAFLIYLGTKKQYPELLHHTLILSERYKALINDIFNKKILPDDFSMYLHAPTRSDPSMAPAGGESMYVLIPVSNLAGKTDWQQMRQPFTDKILQFLEHDFGLKDLKKNIEVIETFSPVDFQMQRNSFLGSPWGMEPHLLQTALFRPHNRSEDIEGLYFSGAGTHPGAGLPGVLLSAEVTEKVIRDDIKISSGEVKEKVKEKYNGLYHKSK